MAEDNQRTSTKAASVRDASDPTYTPRTAKKARSYREETYKPADPDKPGPQTIILGTGTSDKKSSQASSSRSGSGSTDKSSSRQKASDAGQKTSFKEKINILLNGINGSSSSKKKGESTSDPDQESGSGSEYRKKHELRRKRNELLKKGLFALIALILIILIIVIIINSSQVKDVSNLSITSTATTQTLNWQGSKKGVNYEVYRSQNSGQYQLIDTLTDGETSRTYDNLTAGTLYSYRIVAVKSSGEKTEGSSIEGYTKPNTVTRTAAVTTAENTLTVSWSLQGNTADYELQYGLYDNLRDASTIPFSSADAVYNANSDSYSYTINGLVTNETYYMSMRTVCDDTASEWCPVFSGTVTVSADITDIDTDAPMIALTFDSGPDYGTVTTRILDTLAQNDALATFFPTGENAQLHSDLMQRIVDEGHEIGNHTYDNSHSGGEVTADDITSANAAIEAACSVTPKLFRPPQGEVTDAIADACRNAGMAIITFNFDSHDWELFDADSIIDRILTYAEDGDIIQFRFMDDYDQTAQAIETIVPSLRDEGFQLVTVTQLIQAKTGAVPAVGQTYSSAFAAD